MDVTIFFQLLLFGVVWGGLYALIATGLNVIFGVMKILNIAHGELLMLGAYMTYWMFTLWGISPLISLPLVTAVMFLFGMLIQKCLIEVLVERSTSPVAFENATLIIFFGGLLVLQNVALLLWTADYRVINYLSDTVHIGPVSVAANRLVVLFVALVLTAALYVALKHTMMGKAIRAVSQDRATARLMGINVKTIGLIGFGIGAAVAGAAGSLAATVYVITPAIGLLFTIKAFTVMVVGGLGSPVGALIAGLSLGILESFASFMIGAEFKDVVGYLLLVGFIVLKSRGRSAFASEVK